MLVINISCVIDSDSGDNPEERDGAQERPHLENKSYCQPLDDFISLSLY